MDILQQMEFNDLDLLYGFVSIEEHTKKQEEILRTEDWLVW